MRLQRIQLVLGSVAVIGIAALLFGGCGQKATPVGENLIKNGSFEQIADGIPKDWKINNFRGLPDELATQYGVTDSLAYDGRWSFFFKANERTQRFFLLSQEIKVKGVKRVRVRGRIRAVGVGDGETQYPQAGFALTYYTAERTRFEGSRFADDRTEPVMGTTDGWVLTDQILRLPENVAYIVFHCVLGMDGEMWFDDISLEVPAGLPWRKLETQNVTHYYLDREYPEGSIEYQQQLIENYAAKLGIPLTDFGTLEYYFYPDTTLMREALGFKGTTHVDYARRDIHSVNPVDNHEIAHLLTDPYGTLPKVLSEGTAFYLIGEIQGEPVQPLAQKLLQQGELPTLRLVLDPMAVRNLDHTVLLAAAASFVGYLIEVGGQKLFLELHGKTDVYANYDQFAASFESVYGKSLEDTEAAWRRTLARADFSQHNDQSETGQ